MRSLIFLGCLLGACLADMPSTVLTKEEANQLVALVKSKPVNSAKTAFQIAKSVEILGGSVSDIKSSLCSAVSKFDETNIDQVLHVVIGNIILGCENAPSPSAALVEKVADLVEEESDLRVLLPALRTYVALGKTEKLKVDPEALAPVVARLEELRLTKGRYQLFPKEEQGSYLASGRAWYALAVAYANGNLEDDDLKTLLSASEGVSAMLKVLQKELGADSRTLYISDGDNKDAGVLQTTSEVVVGIVQLARALDQDLDVTPAQVDKFASFFLGQKDSLHSVEDVFYFASAIAALSDNPISVPLAAVLKQRVLQQSAGTSGALTLTITDLFDRPTVPCKVIAVRASVRGAVAPLLTNQEAFPASKEASNTEYSLNFFSAKPEPGVYDIDFSVSPLETSDKKYATSNAIRSVKVATSASVSNVVIAILNADGSESKKYEVDAGKKLKEGITAQTTQSLLISLDVRSATSGKAIKPHQLFARFESESGSEAFFVVPFSDKKHQLKLNLAEAASQFSFASGTYTLRIIVADANLLEPIIWDAATVTLSFPAKSQLTKPRLAYEPLPTIEHQFRQPDKRASGAVSRLFTGLVLAPIPILLIALLTIGFNFSNTPSDPVGFLSTILFFVSIGAIVALITAYWFSLTIFQTLNGLLVLGPFTALVGTRALSAIQDKALQAKAKRD